MRKLLLAGIAVLALAACSPTSPAGQAVVQTVALTSADLTAAQAAFVSAEPSDPFAVLGASCFGWMNTQLPSIQAALAPTGGISAPPAGAGAFTLFADGTIALDAGKNAVGQVTGTLPVALEVGFDQNCGPYVSHVVGNINWLLQQVGAKALGVSTHGIL